MFCENFHFHQCAKVKLLVHKEMSDFKTCWLILFSIQRVDHESSTSYVSSFMFPSFHFGENIIENNIWKNMACFCWSICIVMTKFHQRILKYQWSILNLSDYQSPTGIARHGRPDGLLHSLSPRLPVTVIMFGPFSTCCCIQVFTSPYITVLAFVDMFVLWCVWQRIICISADLSKDAATVEKAVRQVCVLFEHVIIIQYWKCIAWKNQLRFSWLTPQIWGEKTPAPWLKAFLRSLLFVVKAWPDSGTEPVILDSTSMVSIEAGVW